MSSAKRRREIARVSFLFEGLILPEAKAISMVWDQNSRTRTNKWGERGHPYLNPLLLLKFPAGELFSMTEKVGEERHSLIQLIHLLVNSKQWSM